MTRPILVFGAGGRVGQALLQSECIDGIRADREILGIARWGRPAIIGQTMAQTNICDPVSVAEAVATFRPAAIVNLAACTLPRAEQPDANEEAWEVNSAAVLRMSSLGVPIVHISTDCVFDGEKAEPYTPDDATYPLNVYGASKLRGEEFLMDGPPRDIIIRTTGVYLSDKPNFLKLVLDKAKAGEELTVVSDSIYTPTDARELAKAILLATERVIADPSVSGTYHFAGPDVMSYMDFADLVLEEAGLSMPIHATTMAEREKIEGFKRPKNAALNSDKFAETFGMRHRPTRACVRELVKPR